jgi:hypothetical protein
MPPPAATPAPAQARPAPTSPSFGAPDADPFGSVGVDLTEPPSDFGSAPEFDPVPPSFSAPVPVAPPVVPPAAPPGRRPPSGRHPSAPAPAAQPPLAVGRPPPAALQVGRPPTGAPPGRLAPSPATLPPARLPPSPLAPPSAPVPSAPASSAQFADADPFGAVNMDLSEPPPDLGPPPEFGDSPMFDAPAAPAPSAPPAAMPFMDEFGSPGLEMGGQQPAAPPGNFSAPPPIPQPQAGAGMPDSFAPPGPMDFGMLGDEQMPSEPEAMAAAPGMPDPFAPPAGMDDPFAPPAPGAGMPDPFAPPGPAAGMPDPFAPPGGMDDPFAPPGPAAGMPDPFEPPGPAPAGNPDPFASQAGMADPFAAPSAGQDPFAAQAPGAGMDPFAMAEPAFSPTATGRQRIGGGEPPEGFLTQTDTSHQTIGATDTGRSMFDMPDRSAAQMPSAPSPGTRELIDLPAQPEEPPPAVPVSTLAAPPITRPAGRPADMGIPERRKPSAAQQVTGQVAYLTIAAGLLLALTASGGVSMKEGRVDASALSPSTIIKLMGPKQLVMRDVTNGLYDTRSGTSLFYVRGEVENRDSKPVRVKVRAGLYEGGQRVNSAEGLAGLAPTPEDLHGITSPEAATQLRTRLDAGAVDIAPGARAPFTLVFHEYPQDLSAYRLKVTLEPVTEEGSRP